MKKPPIITIQMVPPGVELVVRALRNISPLPDPNIDGLVNEIWGQYAYQMQELQKKEAEEAKAAKAKAPKAPAAEQVKSKGKARKQQDAAATAVGGTD